MHDAFGAGLGNLAWQVKLRKGCPVWLGPENETPISREPGTTLGKRLALKVIGVFLVEWLL